MFKRVSMSCVPRILNFSTHRNKYIHQIKNIIAKPLLLLIFSESVVLSAKTTHPTSDVTSVPASVTVHSSSDVVNTIKALEKSSINSETSFLSTPNHSNSFPSDPTSSSSSLTTFKLLSADTIDGLTEACRKSTRNRSKANSDHHKYETHRYCGLKPNIFVYHFVVYSF